MVEVRENQTTEEILQRNGKMFRERILSSLEEMLALSKYSRDETLSELGLSTEVFITIVLALANKDLFLCVSLLKLVETISPLLTANRYIAHQMLEMFQISPRVIQEALQYLDKLEKSQLFNIPDSIGAILRHTSDIVIDVQSASTIPTNEISAEAQNPEDQVEYSRSEPREAVEVISEREETTNDMEQVGDLPNQRETINMIVRDAAEEGDSPLHICVQNKSEAGVKVLWDSGYDVKVKNNHNKTRLMLAAEIGDREIVVLLRENNEDTNISDGDTPLFPGDLRIIRMLVDKGADIDHKNSKGFTVLYRAEKEPKVFSAIFFKELGANLCPDDIIAAATYWDVRTMELFKELGADINVRDSSGWTPLHWALHVDNVPLVKYLVKVGADLNARTSSSGTPLYFAVLNGNVPLVKYMVEAGADPKASTSNGSTLLHTAVYTRNELLVRYLVELGADPNASTSDGWTPLHWAVNKNNELLVRYLVESGADPKASDSSGRTPLSLSKDPKISAYLRSKGALK